MLAQREVRRPGALVRMRPGRAGLGDAGSVQAQFNAQVQAQYNALSDGAKAQVQAATGIDANAQAEKGAQATYDLASNGYNPDDPADNAKLVHAISGGLALAPPPGILLAGAVELLWQVGNAVACPVTHLLGGKDPRCGDPPCEHTGVDVTPSRVIDDSRLGGAVQGSFRAFLVGVLAVETANLLNCKGGLTPGHVVDAAVLMWNKTHAGPAVQVFIPAMNTFGSVLIPLWGSGNNEALQSAFLPLSQTGSDVQFWASTNPNWVSWMAPSIFPQTDPRLVSVNSGALLPPAEKVVHLHTAPLPPPTPAAVANWMNAIESEVAKALNKPVPPPWRPIASLPSGVTMPALSGPGFPFTDGRPTMAAITADGHYNAISVDSSPTMYFTNLPAGMSTGAKIATGTAVVVGGSAIAAAFFGWAKGKGVSYVFDTAWDKVKGVFR